ncbi:8-oxoguanine DNA glycosylase OGG fold protein [Streptomyces sp. NPDC088817]|uniref:8-oxoguanine DNA glycosylase OGG fold protein n=1 Tax=Streptomyces sp. NPDC088817 TaxID=3365907 RepID=UPI0038074B8C
MFGIAGQADTVEGRRHLLVAALVWGTGTKARSVKRRAHIFVRSSPADIDARLGEALDVLRERGAADAYRALNSEQHIPYLGPAFFTKVLYFAGHGDGAAPQLPVILDSVVSRALVATGAADASWPGNGWTTAQYRLYMDGVNECARARGALPDQVEAALVSHGKKLA